MKSLTIDTDSPSGKSKPWPEFTLLELMEEVAGQGSPDQYEFLSVREMAKAIGRSKAAVRNYLDRLESRGYRIITSEKDYVTRSGRVQPVPAYAVIGKVEEDIGGEEGVNDVLH